MSKTVLITGASRGIGAETARRFAREGYAVGVNYCKSQAQAEELVRELEAMGVSAKAYQADVSDRTQVDRMVADFLKDFGHMDVLVCNAGIARQELFTDVTLDQWRQMLGINLDGVFHCCQAALPDMIRRKSGRIITLSSMWGQVGASCEAAYSATKGAVIALTKALAKELGPSGVRVNCVAPGVILTDMCASVEPEILAEMAEETPVGRNGRPEDVAKAFAYLADAEFVTGQVIPVNGGYVI